MKKPRRTKITARERDEMIAAIKPILIRYNISGDTLGRLAGIAQREIAQ